jgi:hypothetical protein
MKMLEARLGLLRGRDRVAEKFGGTKLSEGGRISEFDGALASNEAVDEVGCNGIEGNARASKPPPNPSFADVLTDNAGAPEMRVL